MAGEIIRPSELPARTSPVASEIVPSDNGTSVGGVTWEKGVAAGRPLANQAEAEAGENATKAMTPLTTAQAIDAQTPPFVAAEIAKLDLSGVQSRTWAGSDLHPLAAPSFIRTAGYSSAGDGGGALYKSADSEPSHAGKFSITLEDGVTVAWYEIAESVITPRMLGAAGDGDGVGGGTNDHDALEATFAVAAAIGARDINGLGLTYRADAEVSYAASAGGAGLPPDRL